MMGGWFKSGWGVMSGFLSILSGFGGILSGFGSALTGFGIFCCIAFLSCSPESGFTKEESAIINSSDSILRVLTIKDSSDLKVLRSISSDLPASALVSDEYARLSELMLATVTHPSQDGVGIAAPQIGINRRVIAVQRFDKEPVLKDGKMDYPFEVYPNIHLVWASDSLALGPEGCLSVPDMSGEVVRATEIVIEYSCVGECGIGKVADVEEGCESGDRCGSGSECGDMCEGEGEGEGEGEDESGDMCEGECWKDGSKGSELHGIHTVRDTISGFTAVIFQHEIDHLEGVLYIDRSRHKIGD